MSYASLSEKLTKLAIKPHPRRRFLALVYHQRQFEIRCPTGTSKKTIYQWLHTNQSEILRLMAAKEQNQLPPMQQFGEQGYFHLNGEHQVLPDMEIAKQKRWLQSTLCNEQSKWLNWIEMCAEQIGCLERFNELKLRKTKSKWGHCTVSGRIQLNWQLAAAPEAIQFYVIAHEVAHLREMNHSVQFWQWVASLDKDYHTHRVWLKQHGDRLAW